MDALHAREDLGGFRHLGDETKLGEMLNTMEESSLNQVSLHRCHDPATIHSSNIKWQSSTVLFISLISTLQYSRSDSQAREALPLFLPREISKD